MRRTLDAFLIPRFDSSSCLPRHVQGELFPLAGLPTVGFGVVKLGNCSDSRLNDNLVNAILRATTTQDCHVLDSIVTEMGPTFLEQGELTNLRAFACSLPAQPHHFSCFPCMCWLSQLQFPTAGAGDWHCHPPYHQART